MDTTGTILLFGLVFGLLLLGLGVYFVSKTDAFSEWWERFKANQAARNDQAEAHRAALQREQEVGVEIGLPPSEALERAVEAMTRSGYGLESRTENTVTFARHEGANACLGCFLMLFLFIPGLLYLLLAERTVRVTIAAYPITDGSRLVIGGDDLGASSHTINWARTLPKPGEWEPEQPVVEPSATETSTREWSPAEALRELAELRDAGIITPEEFEAKKDEILRRM